MLQLVFVPKHDKNAGFPSGNPGKGGSARQGIAGRTLMASPDIMT